MKQFPKKLQDKLNQRATINALRKLDTQSNLVDFTSNDYLGFSKSKHIFNQAHQSLINTNAINNGATGSRLLSGNHPLYGTTERLLSEFHDSESALLFNSGYDANLGLLAAIPQKGDYIFYDAYSHASIRDGILLSHAKAYKFEHNNLDDLQQKIKRLNLTNSNLDTAIYIVTESVFSMDGDSPNLIKLSHFCAKNNYHLLVDEAHAIGVFGNGKGLVQELNIQDQLFARLITFGKALGAHGAAVLGSKLLKQYLINFSRPLIYTTALPPHSLSTINSAYKELKQTSALKTLQNNIEFFKLELKKHQLNSYFIESNSAIHSCLIPGNNAVKAIAQKLKSKGIDVKAILAPTVSRGQERLRFCLHSYNSEAEITKVLTWLATFVEK